MWVWAERGQESAWESVQVFGWAEVPVVVRARVQGLGWVGGRDFGFWILDLEFPMLVGLR